MLPGLDRSTSAFDESMSQLLEKAKSVENTMYYPIFRTESSASAIRHQVSMSTVQDVNLKETLSKLTAQIDLHVSLKQRLCVDIEDMALLKNFSTGGITEEGVQVPHMDSKYHYVE